MGKTEIARRIAKLVDAPFVKVEATKFTEVGYVGRDVDTIIKDLVRNPFQFYFSTCSWLRSGGGCDPPDQKEVQREDEGKGYPRHGAKTVGFAGW